ncbi:MAG: hypothetical protein F4Z35_09650 [Dehalococcoidia bacterium]|nr:hypothetical protein [Dehalococcoidia bacterium]
MQTRADPLEGEERADAAAEITAQTRRTPPPPRACCTLCRSSRRIFPPTCAGTSLRRFGILKPTAAWGVMFADGRA